MDNTVQSKITELSKKIEEIRQIKICVSLNVEDVQHSTHTTYCLLSSKPATLAAEQN
jgi:ribosome-associated translation inhibitor RaiA